MKRIRLGIFYGGPSLEHEVSLNSAKQVESYLDSHKFSSFRIKISRQGEWPKGVKPETLKKQIDFAFIAMHGEYGEDGTLQAILESHHIPYSGSRVLASSLAMDKFRSGLVARAIGVNTPKTWLVTTGMSLAGLPDSLVLKPNTGGSSQGVVMLSKHQFVKEYKTHPKKYEGSLVQEKIDGREITVSVLGNEALPLIEILPKRKFYDYTSKYEPGQSEHVVNPVIPKKLVTGISDSALRMHEALGCRAMSRSDFILKGSKAYYLETNTIPGLTKTSLLPEAAAAAGVSFPQLLEKIIGYSK